MTNVDPKNNLPVNSFVPTKPQDGLIHDLAQRGLINTLSSSQASKGTDTTDAINLGPQAKLEKLVKEKFNGMTLEELYELYTNQPGADVCGIKGLLDEFLDEDISDTKKAKLLGQIEEKLNTASQPIAGIPNPPAFAMPNMPVVPSFPAGGLGGIPGFPQIPQSSYKPQESAGDDKVELEGKNKERAEKAKEAKEEVKQDKEARKTEVTEQLEENKGKVVDFRRDARIALIEREYGEVGGKEGKIPAEQAKQTKKVLDVFGNPKDDDSQKPKADTKIGDMQAKLVVTNKDIEKLKTDKVEAQKIAAESDSAEAWDAVTRIDNQIIEKVEQIKRLAEEKKKLVVERNKKLEDIKTAKGETEEGKAIKALIDEKEKFLAKAENEDVAEDKEQLEAGNFEGLDKLTYAGEEHAVEELEPILEDTKKLITEKKVLDEGKSAHDSDIRHLEATEEKIKARNQEATPPEKETVEMTSKKPKETEEKKGGGLLDGIGNVIKGVGAVASAIAGFKAATGGGMMGMPGMPTANFSMPNMSIPQSTVDPGMMAALYKANENAKIDPRTVPGVGTPIAFRSAGSAYGNLGVARQDLFSPRKNS